MKFTPQQKDEILRISNKTFRKQTEVLSEKIAEVYYESDITSAIRFGSKYSASLFTKELKSLNLSNEQDKFISTIFEHFVQQTLLTSNRYLLRILDRESRINQRTLGLLNQLISELLPTNNKDYLIYISKKIDLP